VSHGLDTRETNVKIDAKSAAIVIAVAMVAVAAGYWTGVRRSGDNDASATAPRQLTEDSAARNAQLDMPRVAATQRAHPAVMPPGHPPTGGSPSPAKPPSVSAPPQSGRAHQGQVNPDARFTHFRVGQRNVKRILADGNYMWVGTSGGVIRYDTRTDEYRLFDLRSGLLANGVFYVGKLGKRIVAGTYGGGMAVFDDASEKWNIYNIPQGLADAFVYDVLQLDNGDVWIATWSGANRVRGGKLDDRASWDTFTVANTQGGLPNDWVYGLAKGEKTTVWLATEGGLARYSEGKWKNWQHKDGLGAPFDIVRNDIQFRNDPAQFSKHHARQKNEMGLQNVDVAYNPNYIVSLLVDSDGSVWCGTWGGGLSRFDGEKWQTFTVKDGLPGNHVFALHKDPEGRLWVGTSSGLARREGDGFKTYTTADGLFSNLVFSIATGSDGSAWIGSFGGVARVANLR